MNRRGVSLMISYVLLISIAIVMSIAIYGWLKLVANVEPVVDCESGTSVTIQDVTCDVANKQMIINVKNNGLFSFHGFIINVGDSQDQVPIKAIIPIPPFPGRYTFSSPLKPGEERSTLFSAN